jgi:Ring finger domain
MPPTGGNPNNDDCPICLERLPAQDRDRTRCPNNHAFCKECFDRWAEQATVDVRCPLCRESFTGVPHPGQQNYTGSTYGAAQAPHGMNNSVHDARETSYRRNYLRVLSDSSYMQGSHPSLHYYSNSRDSEYDYGYQSTAVQAQQQHYNGATSRNGAEISAFASPSTRLGRYASPSPVFGAQGNGNGNGNVPQGDRHGLGRSTNPLIRVLRVANPRLHLERAFQPDHDPSYTISFGFREGIRLHRNDPPDPPIPALGLPSSARIPLAAETPRSHPLGRSSSHRNPQAQIPTNGMDTRTLSASSYTDIDAVYRAELRRLVLQNQRRGN